MSTKQDNKKDQGEGLKRSCEEEAAVEQAKKRQKQLLQQQQQELARRGIFSLNGLARSMRAQTASKGERPVFNESIWKDDDRKRRPEKERSVSPKTVVKKEEEKK